MANIHQQYYGQYPLTITDYQGKADRGAHCSGERECLGSRATGLPEVLTPLLHQRSRVTVLVSSRLPGGNQAVVWEEGIPVLRARHSDCVFEWVRIHPEFSVLVSYL